MTAFGLDHIRLHRFSFEHRGGVYGNVTINAGIPTIEHIVAPSGREWNRAIYPVNVEVTSSPTGRSVQVWVNGRRVYPEDQDIKRGNEE